MAVSLQQFVENLTRSGLMTADEISSFQQSRPAEKQPKDAQTLAQALVQAGKLTKYQAQMVYQGRPKGLVFGEYTVLDKLGQGGMGVVLKAQHRRMKRMVAVKVLPAAAMKSPEAVKRFYREVEAAAKLNHPNIVQAYDAGESEGIHYLVMECVEGKDLASVVKNQGPLEVKLALDCIVQAAKGLAYAHREGVIHRDIKPGNLLLDKEGTVKILDMGLARVALAVGGDGPDDERLTQSGQVMGTCDYMAPEQAEDTHRADQRSDIYSLGCTLYRLLTGKALYSGDSLVSILLAHQNAPIPSLQAARPEVPAGVAAIFEKMVAKRPEDRYPSMAEVIAAVDAFLGGSSRSPVRVLAPEPPSEFLPESLAFLREPPPMPATQQRKATVAKPGVVPAVVREDTLRPSTHDDTGASLVGHVKRAVTSVKRIPTPLLTVAGGTAAFVVLVGLVLTLTGKGGDSLPRPPGEGRGEGSVSQNTTAASPHPNPLPKGEGTVAPPLAASGTAEEFPGLPQTSASRDDSAGKSGSATRATNDYDSLATGKWIDVLNSPEAVAKARILDEAKKPEDAKAEPSVQWMNGEVQVKWYVALLDRPVKDCLIRAKVRKVSGHSVGFMLRNDEDFTNAYYLITDPGVGCGGIGRKTGGNYQFLWTSPSDASPPQPQEGYFEIALAAIGDSLKTYVNGKAFGEARDETHRARIPCVYVFNWEKIGEALFKDIQIQVLDRDGASGSPAGQATNSADGAEPKSPHPSPLPKGEGTAPPPPAIVPFDAAVARKHQEAWAKHLGVPVEFTNSIGMKFALIPPGEFDMGSRPEEIAEQLDGARAMAKARGTDASGMEEPIRSQGPLHRVRLTGSFYLGRFEVTVGQFREFVRATGYKTSAERDGIPSRGFDATTRNLETRKNVFSWENPGFPQTDVQPVSVVNWFDAEEFCKWLSVKEGRSCGLPTEAQWEYACRSGTESRWSTGNDLASVGRAANLFDASLKAVSPNGDWVTQSLPWDDGFPFSAPVGRLEGNAFRLHDMHGNVAEWSAGWFDKDYYGTSPSHDPTGPPSGRFKVIRSGSSFGHADYARSACRGPCDPRNHNAYIGFRVVAALPAATKSDAAATWFSSLAGRIER